MGADTPLHEFIHVYFAVLKESNPQAYADIIAEVQKIPEIQRMIDKKINIKLNVHSDNMEILNKIKDYIVEE